MRWSGLALLAGAAGAQTTKAPTEVQNARVFEHRTGPEQAVHMSSAMFSELEKARLDQDSLYFQYDVVVSAAGLVESIKLTKPKGEDSSEADAIARARVYKPWVIDGVPARVKIEDSVNYLPPERWGPHVPFPSQVDRGTLEMGLARSRCFGTCPSYQVTVLGDGTVRWFGGYGTKAPGHHVGHVSEGAVTDLLLKFRNAEFLSALPEYHSNWTDHPTYVLTLKVGASTKTVVDYDGLRMGLPLAVRNLEEELDEDAGTAVWVKGGPELAASLKAENWDFGAATPDNMMLYLSALGSGIPGFRRPDARDTGDRELIDLFVKAKAPVTIKFGETEVPLCVASGTGDVDLVRRMLTGVEALPAGIADSCLTRAAGSKSLAMVDLWVGKGGDPRVRSVGYDGQHPAKIGPLESAISTANAPVVKRLLQLKADASGLSSRKEPLLSLAVENGRNEEGREVVEMLIQAGANVNARSDGGETPLFAARDSPESIKPLLAAGANIEAKNNYGETPLLHSIFYEAAVRELLADGADPTVISKTGQTTVQLARQYGCEPCAVMVEEAIKKKTGVR